MAVEEIVYEDVSYKGEPGTLTINDKVFHYQANATNTSVKCSWARVEKRQLSPESAATHMIKLVLVSGKTAVFTVKDRATLEEMRSECQTRMDAAKARTGKDDMTKSMRMNEARMDNNNTRSSAKWQDEPVKPRQSTTTTRVTTHHHHYDNKNKQEDNNRGDRGWWCCNLLCLTLTCCICILIAIAAFLVYWFVIRDNEEQLLKDVGITQPTDESKPPDHGKEERYGIRSVDYNWDSEEVILSYRLSDYIMDNSINYKLYDGLACRTDSNDITRDNSYLFMEFEKPNDAGYNLANKGTGTRGPFDLRIAINKATITDAPFFVPVGLNTGQLNFCVGLAVNYNKIDWWNKEEEVNAVETAIQMTIDMSDFRRIDDFAIKTIVHPLYTRRSLRGSPENELEVEELEEVDFLPAAEEVQFDGY